MLKPILGAAFLFAVADAALAEQGGPSAFKVVNVSANDVLNIRSGPSADHAIVAELQPDSRGIVVTGSCRAQWCPVQHEIGSGWVNRRFIAGEGIKLASLPSPCSDAFAPERAAPRAGAASGAHPAETAFNFFLAQGWSEHQAAGIVGNLQVECGPAFTCSNGSGGIAQWRGDRVSRFRQIFGYSFSSASLQDQLAYIQWELTHPDSPWKESGFILRNARDEISAASLFDQHYERSAGTSRGQRISNARAILKKYGGRPAS